MAEKDGKNWFSRNVFDIDNEDDVEPIAIETNPKQHLPAETFMQQPQQSNGPVVVSRIGQAQSVMNASSYQIPTIQAAPVVDQKFIDYFLELFDRANLPGPDYYEMMIAVNNMRGTLGGSISDVQIFQAVWTTLKATAPALIPQVLIDSNGKYRQILENDRISFQTKATDSLQREIGGLENEIKTLETQNQAAQQKMAELQQQIANNQNAIQQKTQQKIERSSKIEKSRNDYETVYSLINERLNNDLAIIQHNIR